MEKNKVNEDIIRFHQNKRKMRKIRLAIVSISLIVMALMLIGLYRVFNKEHYINYTETADLNYSVNLVENEFYENNYLKEGTDVIASLIKDIDVEFKYNLELDEEIEYIYSYKILAEIEVKEKSKTNLLYETEEIIKKQQQEGKTKKVIISEKINLDYNEYNNQINRLIEAYKLANTSSEIHLNMYLDVKNKNTGERINKENKVMSLQVPLTTKTIEITLNENVKDSRGQITIQENEYEYTKIFLPIGILQLISGLIVLGYLIKYILKTRSAEKMYDDELKKIMFDYKSYIQKINNNVDRKDYKIIRINTFQELIEMKEDLQSPILMYIEEDLNKTSFMILNGNLLFEYVLGADLIRENLIREHQIRENKRKNKT